MLTSRRFRTLAIACSVAVCAFAPAAHAAAPAPCNGKFLIADKAGDQQYQQQGNQVFAAPANADVIGVFFRVDDGKVTANLAISDLTKTLPPDFEAIRYRAYATVGDQIRYFQALLTADGVKYSYGHQPDGAPSYSEDGETTGTFFEGKNGVVQIVLPADAGGKPGTKLNATSGSIGLLKNGDAPAEAQLPPVYYGVDTAPDGAADGPSTTPVACDAPATSKPGGQQTPQPAGQPQTGSTGTGSARVAPGLTFRITPGRDKRPPYAFRTIGSLAPPAGTNRSQACSGRVSIVVKRGRKTISSRAATVGSDCTFAQKVRFDRKRVGSARSLRWVVTYQGNGMLLPQKAKARTVRVR
jgi:hypothetical protein